MAELCRSKRFPARTHRHPTRQGDEYSHGTLRAGDVVAVLEWDSDRYHECYFAVPMMGAALQTINVSLTPEDIAYTINDSGATTVLFNADFLPLIEKLKDNLKAVKTYVLMHDRPEPPKAGACRRCLMSNG